MSRIHVIPLVLLATACGSPGNVTFTTWGESFIEQKIPAETFADGWEIKYSKFFVTIEEITVANHDGKVAAKQSTPKLFDVHKAGPVNIETFSSLDPEEWDAVSYAIGPSSAVVSGNVDAADVDFMKEHGYSIYLEATVTKGAVTKSYKWGFSTDTLYQQCQHADYGKGLTVPSGGSLDVQLTIHGDHLYYDDLQSSQAKVRFDAIAGADKDNDGEITLEELDAVDLTSLPIGQYGTGGAHEVNTLRDFVTALARTIGHYRGEGECEPSSRK
jgi:hypothetical protein